MEPRLFLLETAKCLVNGRESPAVLITHNDEKCNGSFALVYPSNHTGRCNWAIQFPDRSNSVPTNRCSLILHWHKKERRPR
jgi:hypothetical protein